MKAVPRNASDADEAKRLAALDDYQILDTPEEPLYDAFTLLARDIFNAGGSMISLLDDRRQWFKSHVGLEIRETPRELAFCNYPVATKDPLIVSDARSDSRFASNPLVTGEPHIRFYAGVPLTTPEGHAIGTLCVIDSHPRDVTPSQLASLKALATAVMGVLDARRRFLALFESSRIDLLTIDAETQTIQFASRGAATRLGYTFRDLAGMPVCDLIPALRRNELESAIAAMRDGKPMVRELDVTRRDGSTYPAEIRLDITRESGRERLLAVATDLSERKAVQREIDLLLGAINAAGDVILVYRVDDRGKLVLDYMNDAYAAQTGYSREEALGRELDAFRGSMPDDDGMRAVRAAVEHGRAAEVELISYRKDGTTYWNQVTLHPIAGAEGSVTHWIAIERDITDEVNRTSALAEEHDRLLALTRAARRLFTALEPRSLVATMREVLHELLGANARVLAVAENGGAAEVEELGVADFSNAFFDDLVAQSVANRSRAVDESRERAVAFAGRFGENRYALELRAPAVHPLRNTDLFVFDLVTEYFTVAARNVTLYHELDERRTAVLELNQTKTDLIAMLAHDFRGPLTSIVGFSDLMTEVGEVSNEQRDFLETIKRSAMQLSELATDTLTLARLERNEVTLQLGDVDLASLIAGVVEQYVELRSLDVSVSGDVRIVGDDDRLRQVFSNLIDNAIKYSPNGKPPQVTVDGSRGTVTVKIRDFGIGIPSGELSTIFDRFSRASNARRLRISGTGFGLFLTKQLVQLHGGTIAVESKENEGSTFIVTLPRLVTRRNAPRTVVVLDPERDRSFLAYGLREAGYRIVTAASLEEVFATADGQIVDALIVSLPDAELTRDREVQLRALSRERSIPIIAVANQASSRLAAAATLLRPVLIGDVVAALERVLTPARA